MGYKVMFDESFDPKDDVFGYGQSIEDNVCHLGGNGFVTVVGGKSIFVSLQSDIAFSDVVQNHCDIANQKRFMIVLDFAGCRRNKLSKGCECMMVDRQIVIGIVLFSLPWNHRRCKMYGFHFCLGQIEDGIEQAELFQEAEGDDRIVAIEGAGFVDLVIFFAGEFCPDSML